MRFFGDKAKTRVDNKISWFAGLFKHQLAFCSVRHSQVSPKGWRLRLFFATLMVFLGGFSSYLWAAFEQVIEPEVVYEPQTINLFPGKVTGSGWRNVNYSLVPDLTDNSLYGDFDDDNATVLEQITEITNSPVTNDIVTPDAADPVPPDDTGIMPLEDLNATSALPASAAEPPPPDPELIEESQPTETDESAGVNESVPADVTVPAGAAMLNIFENVYGYVTSIFSSSTTPEPTDAVTTPSETTLEVEVPAEVTSDFETVTDPAVLPDQAVNSTTTPADLDSSGVEPVVKEPELDQTLNSSTTPENSLVESACLESLCPKQYLEFSDFSVGDGFDEQKILNIQLRLSLAAKPIKNEGANDEKIIIEYFNDDVWISGGEINITEETSSAINGGYFLFAYPLYDLWTELAETKVRISYVGDDDDFSKVLLDSIWLEVDSIDNAALNETEPLITGPTKDLKLRQTTPEGYTLDFAETKKDFAVAEEPYFEFKLEKFEPEQTTFEKIGDGVKKLFGFEKKSKSPPTLTVINEELKDFTEVVDKGGGEYELLFKKSRQFKPGKYVATIEIKDEDGSFFIDQEFTWGVLAINTNKSIYYQGDEAAIFMGVLDDGGYTICDAALELKITSPIGTETTLKTADGSILYGSECAGDTFITTPDYSTTFDITESALGPYALELKATTANGDYTISDSFEVREAVPYVIERSGPTRIYPLATYPVELTITANQDFSGQIIDYVPQSFQVYESASSEASFRTHEIEDAKQLIWTVSLKAGETITLAYEFDAPDISPEFYLLGPLEVGDFAEIREWQIASDAPDRARIVQSVVGAVADSTTYTATFPGTPTIGNTIIMVAIHRDNAVSFATPAGGFTQAVYSNSANFIDVGIWYKVVNSASTTYTITKPTGGNESGMIVLLEVDNLDTSDLIDVVASNDQTATNARTAYTGLTATSSKYGFAVAANGWGDDDFTNPTTASWASSSTEPYTQFSWTEWATSNAGSLGVAYANIDATARQGATLTVTGGGGTEDRNSVIAVFNLAPQIVTVGSIGNQNTPLKLGTNNNYVGGAFTLVPDNGTTSVTGITVTETGTVDAQNDLSGIKLRYEMDSTAPYNCASVSYNGTELQYGATSTSFTAANGTATFNGAVTVSTTSAMCVYPVLDIDATANDGDTLELEIANPSTQVILNEGSVTPATAVSLSDTSDISIGYVPNTPIFAETPVFEAYRSTTTRPVLGGFAATDDDGDLLQYEVTIDDDYDLSSPATTTYSYNYPSDTGWASSSFASGATTTYRVHANDALTPGTTYWYAVRARDPANTNEWSATSSRRSFTISASISVPEWYQTTYEQFQQATFDNTEATSSGSVVISSTTQSFNWLTTPVDISPGTAGSWITVDVSSYVPSDATGVILQYDMSNSGGNRDLGFRHGDSTDNRTLNVEVEKHDWAFAGLNSSLQFDAYVENINVDVYLMGYTTDGVTFFTNSANKTLSSNSTWQDISIAADTGADTAVGAIVEIVHTTNNDTWGLRKNGSTDSRTAAYGRYHNWAIIGVDSSEVFEGWANDVTDTTFHVIGYVTKGATFFTNSIDRTPSAGVGWVDTDITGDLNPGDNAIGAFVEVYGTNNISFYGLRRNGDTSTGGSIYEEAKRHAWGIVAVDNDDIYESQLETGSNYTNNLIGYATANAIGSVMSQPVDFDWVSNQNDWGEITWQVTEPAGSNTYLQVYYGPTCSTIVPNGALAGNATGFSATSSPVDISGLATSTYNQICVKVTLDQSTASQSPELDSWGISWVPKSVFNQEAYRWYANNNTNTPTDAWPTGATDLLQNEAITSSDPTKINDVLRLRMGVGVSSVAATGLDFKLQYAEGLTCDPNLSWVDVAGTSSTTALWRGYNNASVNDGATIPSLLLTGSDNQETYEEENNSAAMPNSVAVGNTGEWDWVLQNNADPGTSYCFRMVNSDGQPFSTYTQYPQLVTNAAPVMIVSDQPFDNEKVATTTPFFEFIATDSEEDTVDYQIEIDNDRDFSSTFVSVDSSVDDDDFLNTEVPADKSPFNQNERMRYSLTSALTNGTTYWWRVRAKDPNGSGEWSEWMTPKSFTVDTSVTIATWFQTTEEQFDTDTLVDTDATGSDTVVMTSVTTGTTTSTALDFDDADTGNAWGQLSWSDSTPGGSNILYRMEYYDGSQWSLIPDGDLVGNAAGFTNSPVDLINLDTETYNQIRIRANFTYSGSSPTLSDWTVIWGERVSVVTHLSLFDNEKTGTTTPTFTFTTTDPQGQDLQYEFSYSTDNTFTSSTTVNSISAPGFVNLTNGGDTNPFNSGDTISYRIQSALTNGTTYWWRVRAKDPGGGDSYSFWSDPWSFTVDTSVTVSTWFQTTQEQFDTDTLTGVISSTSDSVRMLPPGVTTYNFAGVTNPSATHVARDFEVDVLNPTDPPTIDAVDTLTNTGSTTGTPNLRTGIAGYASDAQATNAQYTSISTSNNTRWQITDPGAGDNAVFWASFKISESAEDVNQIDILLEGYQAAATEAAWLAIWRPGASTPYWQDLSHSQQTGDFNFTASITSNADEYIDSGNNVYLMFFNEDVSDSLFVDYVEIEVTSGAATEGTVYSPAIDYNDGSGPAWGQLTWNDSTPGLSDIRYKVEYLDTLDTWTLIPDSALTNNSIGFTTAPVDLQSLNTATYNEIRLVADMDCSGVNCPVLNDWTLSWSEGFDISGTAFEYDGVSSTTSGTVNVAVNGVLQIGKTGTISNGLWSIDNVTFYPGDVVTVFASGAADGDEAVAVTKYDGSPGITGMRLQKRHISIGSNDNQTLSNIDLGQYDFTDDEDLFYDVNGTDDLDVCADVSCGDASIRVLPGNTYSPGSGAEVLTHDIRIDGTFIAGSNNIRVSGSWDNNATTTMTGSTVILTATTSSESIDQTGALTTAFNNLTFGEGSGAATWNLITALDVDGKLSVNQGTLNRNNLTINVAGNLATGASGLWTTLGTTTFDGVGVSTWTDSNTTKQNIGRVVVDGTAKTMRLNSDVVARSMRIGGDDIFDASSSNFDITVYTNWINNNTFTARQGTVFFAATTSSRVINVGGDPFYDLVFNGSGGAWSFTESDLTISNDLSISAGTVTLPVATTTIAGSFSNSGGTFAHNNGHLYFTSATAETLTLGGSGFNNLFYDVRFQGTGSWTFTEANATTSNDMIVAQGTVTFPSSRLAIGGSLRDIGGAFNPNNAITRLYSSAAESIQAGGSSFYDLMVVGSGTFTVSDSNATITNDLTINSGSLVLPSGTLSLGGSIDNNSTITPGAGTLLFNSSDTGEIVDLGSSSLYNATFNQANGGWTISDSATTTNNLTLTAGTFSLASGEVLSVGAAFTNSIGGASTTWTGSTLSLENGTYSLNLKTNTGDAYNILRIDNTADVAMWNSSAATYDIISGGSLYSQDHNAADGDLYIFGQYGRTSGTEYWSYATDFDGTALGGSSRQVDVRFQNGASASLTNSTLRVVGGAGASTTIANQGSGTYTVSVAAGTTTAQYYNFSDLGATGLSLLSGTIVTSLGQGSYEVDVNGGTAISLSSTTISANPAEQIYNVTFSTTTAINADNVTQTDGTPASYWWFRNSAGNLDGEQFDNDTGNPGSVRWDDSALVFTISGTVYSDDGVTPLTGGTCDGVATPIRVVVQRGATYDTTCSNVNGSFSVPGVTVVGDAVITVYLNGASGGQRAVTITKTPTADITNFNLYAGRVITRHEDVDPLTIADLAVFDFSDDTDIPYTAASTTDPDTLTVSPNFELHIASSTTFAPGGTVTLSSSGSGTSYDATLHIDDQASFVGSGTTTYSIGGSFIMDTGADFTAASSTVNLTATTSGKAITAATGATITFNQLQFTGSGGWNLNSDLIITADINAAAGTVTGSEDITINNGSFYGNGLVSLGSGTTTIARTNTLGGTQGWTFGHLRLGNGSAVGTTTPGSNATTTVSGRLTISTGHYLDAGASRWNLAGTGTAFVESGTFLEDTSTVTYSGTGATNLLSTAYYNLNLSAAGSAPTYTAVGSGLNVLNDLRVANTGTTTVNFTTNDSALNVEGDLTINSRGTFIASDSGSFTMAGDYDNNGVFTASAGTVTFDGSASSNIAAGNSSFGAVVINGTGSFTVSEPATTTGAFTLTNAGSFTLNSGQTLAVGGTFTNDEGGAATTWTGSTLRLFSGTNYQMNAKTINDAYATLSIGANTDVRMWNSAAASYNVNSSGSLYSQDHNDVAGDLYVYGNYPGNGGTDYWSYATDFDGTALGGGSRQVDVRFASGASLSMVNGALQVLGTASATTSIDNQGSGAYGLRLGGSASTTWSYYSIEDIDSAGLTFSGSPNVVTLSRGDIEVTQPGGSGVTVGGSVINNNPAKTFTNNIFSTTTAIAAVNVTATGTSISSWRFTNHGGNIDGEAKDVDPDGDPGYIIWDDSSANITISGNVYSDEGVTVSTHCDGSTNNVRIVVAGLTNYSTSCNASTGFYSISGISYSANDSVIVYLDGEVDQAANVTADPVSNIANMHLYQNRLIVRHENTDPVTIDDLSIWDSSDDADILFTATNGSPDTLLLPANTKLLVWTNKNFTPGGNVTLSGGGAGANYDGTLELQDGATFSAQNGESHSIGGSLLSGSGAVFSAAQSTSTFTTSGAARTVDINNDNFYNVRFTGSGSWSITDTILDVSNDFSQSAGTLTLPSATSTIGGSFNVTGGLFNASGGLLYLTATDSGNTLRFNGSIPHNLRLNGSGGSWIMSDTNATSTGYLVKNAGTLTLPSGVLTVADDFSNTGTLTHNGGTLRLTAATGSTTLTLGANNLNNLVFAGASQFSMTDASATLVGNLSIQSSASVAISTSTLTIGGSLNATGGTMQTASGTVLFNSGDSGETINPGNNSFYNAVFANAAGGWTVSASATSTNNFTLTSGASFTLASGARLYVGGVFTNSIGGAATTWTGSTLVLDSGSVYSINTKTAGSDQYEVLTVGADTDISSWNSRATTTNVAVSSSWLSQDHGGTDGRLNIYGDYHIATTTNYWSYATDFDGAALVGGARRAVTVYQAANSTTTVDGGTLNMVGAAGATTTITNQGSGNYAFRVNDGSFNASYYAYRNLNNRGLDLSGEPTIISLNNGDYELAVSGGSLISLASSTLNANASMVINNNRFATTSAITGYNLNLAGDTDSAWTYTNHQGNFDGESFDNDGGDACGSIRWTDSSCLLTEQTHYRWRSDDGGLGVPNNEWFDLAWVARTRVRITNSDSSAYTDAAVKIPVTYDADMQADFSDLRFTDSSGTTSLPYWVESYTASTEADVWVKLPVLAANATTDIFMYYDNAAASSTASSGAVFIASDDFEDDDISEYSGDTSLFNVGTNFNYGGSYGLDAAGNESSRATDGIFRFDQTVSQGEIIRFFQYIDTVDGSNDEVCTLFAVQSPGTTNLNYAVCLEQVSGTDRISIARNVDDIDTSGVVIGSTTVAYTTGWYEVEIDWQTDDTIDVTLSQNGSAVASTTATDGTYVSGGIGFTYWFQNGGWDNYTSRPRLDNEPVIAFGVEQYSGGASWAGAEDTAGSSFDIGEVARLRLAVENSGLSNSNDYRLEYAEIGVAPSCEAVSTNDYATVPTNSSCGTSPVCMATSTNVANGAATSDLLFNTIGTFAVGSFVEDPSNTTASLTLDQDEYTEVEFAIVTTNNVSGEDMCFRVSDAGTDLDTYLKVARLSLQYDPVFGPVTLNGGQSIILTPGATTTIYATSTVTDLNGFADLTAGTSTIYRSGAGAACSADNNNCYISTTTSQCDFVDCSGNSCTLSCTADIYYHADPTDDGTYIGQEWLAYMEAADATGASDFGSANGVELLSLRALDVENSINYGSLEVAADTGSYNASTTIENLGNASIDVEISGTNLTDGGSSVIPANQQIFATSTFTYSSCVYCQTLSTSTVNYEVDINKPTVSSPLVTDVIYWGIEIPFGAASNPHSGNNTFSAISDN